MKRNPINAVIGKVVDQLDARERAGGTPANRSARRATVHWYLRRADLFRHFTPEQIRELGDDTTIRRLARREHWLTSDDDDRVYVVAEGGLKLIRIGLLGRQLVEGILEPGDMIGRLTGSRDGSYQVESIDQTVLLSVSRADLMAMLANDPELSLDVVQLVEDRERRLEMRLESLVFKDVPTRVIETLVYLARDHGEPCDHGFAVDVRVSQQDIADLVGASRQMVNRVIRDLTVRFYLKRKGRVLCILNMDRLQRLSEQ